MMMHHILGTLRSQTERIHQHRPELREQGHESLALPCVVFGLGRSDTHSVPCPVHIDPSHLEHL